jgi:uncharacterized protein (TIGR03067 family)
MGFRIACLFFATALSLPAAPPGDAPIKKELVPLQGTWKAVAFEVNGENRDIPGKPPQWVIKGNKVFYGGEELAELIVDNTTTPRCFDLSFRKPKKVLEGIYSVEKDTLKLCVNRQAEGAKERPMSFKTKDKPELRLLVFERIKDSKGNPIENLNGFIGVAIKAMKDPDQLSISDVLPDTPARKAGLKKDDILVKVAGQEATDLLTVIRMIGDMKPGSNVTIRVKRGGKEQDITVKVGVMPFFLLN